MDARLIFQIVNVFYYSIKLDFYFLKWIFKRRFKINVVGLNDVEKCYIQ